MWFSTHVRRLFSQRLVMATMALYYQGRVSLVGILLREIRPQSLKRAQAFVSMELLATCHTHDPCASTVRWLWCCRQDWELCPLLNPSSFPLCFWRGVASLPPCTLGTQRSLARGVLAWVPFWEPGLVFPMCCGLPHLIQHRKITQLFPGLSKVLIDASPDASAGRWDPASTLASEMRLPGHARLTGGRGVAVP